MALSKILPKSIASNLGKRRLNINGDFSIAQRGATFNSVAHNARTLDLWQVYKEAGALNITQSTDVPLFLFKNSFKSDTATAVSGATPGLNCFVHKLEGSDVSHLGWGTSVAKSIAISFWVKSTKTGIFTVAIKNSAGDRAYPAEYTVNVTNTWEYKQIIVAGDTTGTWLITNGIGIQIIQTISVDATRRATGNAWGAGNIYASTNQVNGIDNANNNWIMAGFQVEVGSVATPFEHRSFGEELHLCKRYYNLLTTGSASKYMSMASAYNTAQVTGVIQLNPTMRATPTIDIVSGTNYYRCTFNATNFDFNTIAIDGADNKQVLWSKGGLSSLTSGSGGWLQTTNTASYMAFKCDL